MRLFNLCTASKSAYYFKNLDGNTHVNTTVSRLPASFIRKNDQVVINISNLNPMGLAVYTVVSIPAVVEQVERRHRGNY